MNPQISSLNQTSLLDGCLDGCLEIGQEGSVGVIGGGKNGEAEGDGGFK